MNGGGGAFPLLFRERVRVRVDAIGMAGQWSDAADLGSFDNPSGGGVNEWAANQRMGDAADLGGFDRLAAVSTNRQRISGWATDALRQKTIWHTSCLLMKAVKDQQASPYEVLAGVAVEDRDLWNLVLALQEAELRIFGGRYTSGSREIRAREAAQNLRPSGKRLFRWWRQMMSAPLTG